MSATQRFGRLCALVVSSVALSAGVVHADTPVADTPIAATTNPTTLSAYGGVTAWSQYDSATGRYQLALRVKGKLTIPNISNRVSPFDVSLGPDTKGKTVALYSRCTKDGETTGCDAFRYDLSKKKEAKLAAVSRNDEDEAWPSQWKGNYTFVRVKYNNGSEETNRCDTPFTRPVETGYGIKTVSLTRGACGLISGLVLRGTTAAWTVTTFPSGSNRSEVRLGPISGKADKLLTSRTFTRPSDVYGSPVLDSTYVFATRTGVGPTPRFVRLRRDTGSSKEVEAQTILTGPIARDNGVTTYVEAQGANQGSPCAPITPCRIVVAGADPFSSKSRILQPRMTLTPPGEALLGSQPLNVTGSLSAPVVQNGKVTGSQPVAGMPLQIVRAAYSPNPAGQTLTNTSATSTTGPDGSWFIAVPPPLPPFGYYAAATRGAGIASQSAVVVLKTSAVVTLDVSARTVSSGASVTFTGTVSPVQPNRTVNIVLQYAPGATQAIAQPAVGADGTFSATAPVPASGQYIAELPANPFDGSDGNATFVGTSTPVTITVTP